MSKPILGHLKETSDRAAWWLDVYGSLNVPLTSFFAIKMQIGETEDLYYLIDIEQLNDAQLDKVVDHIVKRFNAEPDVVRAQLKEDGNLPIRQSEILAVTS